VLIGAPLTTDALLCGGGDEVVRAASNACTALDTVELEVGMSWGVEVGKQGGLDRAEAGSEVKGLRMGLRGGDEGMEGAALLLLLASPPKPWRKGEGGEQKAEVGVGGGISEGGGGCMLAWELLVRVCPAFARKEEGELLLLLLLLKPAAAAAAAAPAAIGAPARTSSTCNTASSAAPSAAAASPAPNSTPLGVACFASCPSPKCEVDEAGTEGCVVLLLLLPLLLLLLLLLLDGAGTEADFVADSSFDGDKLSSGDG